MSKSPQDTREALVKNLEESESSPKSYGQYTEFTEIC